MMGHTITKHITCTTSQLSRKTIGILIVRVLVVVRFTTNNQIVAGPLRDAVGRSTVTTQLQTRITILTKNTVLNNVVVARKQHTIITGPFNGYAFPMPVCGILNDTSTGRILFAVET